MTATAGRQQKQNQGGGVEADVHGNAPSFQNVVNRRSVSGWHHEGYARRMPIAAKFVGPLW
jgi:hypothetical protein